MIKPGRAPDYRDREDATKKTEPEPKTLFEKYERAMGDGFRALCEAIATIKNKYLYRQIGYDTFEECCEKRWGISRSKGYRLVDAHVTLKSLGSVPEVGTLVSNQTLVAAIKTVPKAQRVKVLQSVAATGPVTARRISEAISPRKPDPVIIDVEPEKITARNPCPACGGTGFAE